jgi:hypothetical protein
MAEEYIPIRTHIKHFRESRAKTTQPHIINADSKLQIATETEASRSR